MCGFQHIVCSDALVEVFRSECHESASFDLVPVVNLATEAVLAHYWDIKPHEEISPSNVSTVDVRRAKLWHFDHQYLFGSPAVVRALAAHGVAGIFVSPGFRGFA
jgi:hypothetical protein